MTYGNRQEEWRADFAVDLGCGALLVPREDGGRGRNDWLYIQKPY